MLGGDESPTQQTARSADLRTGDASPRVNVEPSSARKAACPRRHGEWRKLDDTVDGGPTVAQSAKRSDTNGMGER
jgi:hypothetical protein